MLWQWLRQQADKYIPEKIWDQAIADLLCFSTPAEAWEAVEVGSPGLDLKVVALSSSGDFPVTEGVKADEILVVQITSFTLPKKLTFLSSTLKFIPIGPDLDI